MTTTVQHQPDTTTEQHTCPQCGSLLATCPDPWQHERDYRSSETTWWAASVHPTRQAVAR